MGTFDNILPQNESAALNWAQSHYPFSQSEVVTDAPWAKTLQLRSEVAPAYLKLVPVGQAASLLPIAALARHFSGLLPPLLAMEPGRGWILFGDHGGRTMDYGSPEEEIEQLARTYAGMQVQAAKTAALFIGLPQPQIDSLLEQLLAFLASPVVSPQAPDGLVGAGYFVGSSNAARYHRLLSQRRPLLQKHLAACGELPLTINHGDLRPPNAAIGNEGQCIILDWDDAMVGPAGMSLHALFSGCSVPTILLSGSAAAAAAAETPNALRLKAYIDTLANGGYADAETLRRVLPSTACAGVMQFLLNFAKFAREEGRGGVRDTLESRLTDLLDLSDLLATREDASRLKYAADYEAQGEHRRARRLRQDHAARYPDQAEAWLRLGLALHHYGELEEAGEALQEALSKAPGDAVIHASLARLFMDKLELEQARKHFEQALALNAEEPTVPADLGRLDALEAMMRDAAIAERMPILQYEADETASGVARAAKIALGVKLFDTYGAVQINDAFPVEMIETLQREFMRRYEPYFRVDDHPDALRLGDKRYMLTVDMEEPFDATALIGAPLVLPIVRRLLGDDCVLGAFTAVISLPGSKDQRLHKDHPALFPDTEWHFSLPCFTAQIIIPLVPLDEFTGTTRFYKGTHRAPTEDAEEMGAQDPMVPLGGCILNDYRTAHRGVGNRSKVVRPILTLIYSRPWFRDFKNYGRQPPLRFSDAVFEKMPPNVQSLLAWWRSDRKLDQLHYSQLLQPRETPATGSDMR